MKKKAAKKKVKQKTAKSKEMRQRIVAVPHNEEGVFDSREEIDEWVDEKEKEAEEKKKKDGFLPAQE